MQKGISKVSPSEFSGEGGGQVRNIRTSFRVWDGLWRKHAVLVINGNFQWRRWCGGIWEKQGLSSEGQEENRVGDRGHGTFKRRMSIIVTIR